MACMSSSPFDSDSILELLAHEAFSNVLNSTLKSTDLSPQVTRDSSGQTHNPHDSDSSVFDESQPNYMTSAASQSMTSIPVEVGSEIVQLSVPIDLLCALLLTNNNSTHYTLQDVATASDNLKRFRNVATRTTTTSTATSSILPTPVNEPAIMGYAVTDVIDWTSPTTATPQDNSSMVDIISMSMDVNGSVLVQEMIVKATDFEREIIFQQIISNSVIVSANTHGCRVVQRLLEYGTIEQNYGLFRSLPRYKIVDLCMDVNGNHVMQKFADCLPSFALHEFVQYLTDPPSIVTRLSLHSYGCRVIQRLLVKCAEDDRSTLLGFVISSFPDLVCDQFGNYVAQHSIEFSNEAEKKSIVSVLTVMDVMGLCCNKYASNVVEKAIRIRLGEKTVLHRLIATIIQNEEALLTLMKDKYGNYVVKAICDLNTTEFPEVGYVRNVLLQNASLLKKYTYGFHLVERLEKAAMSLSGRSRAGSSDSSNRSRVGSH